MKRLKLYMILGFLFTAALGTIWHFLYDWTGRGAIAALFFPVNESTWEHMKRSFSQPVLRRNIPACPALSWRGIFWGL